MDRLWRRFERLTVSVRKFTGRAAASLGVYQTAMGGACVTYMPAKMV
jgi:hypothetical protein